MIKLYSLINYNICRAYIRTLPYAFDPQINMDTNYCKLFPRHNYSFSNFHDQLLSLKTKLNKAKIIHRQCLICNHVPRFKVSNNIVKNTVQIKKL